MIIFFYAGFFIRALAHLVRKFSWWLDSFGWMLDQVYSKGEL